MARSESIEARLRNWARWQLGTNAGRLGYAAVRLGSPSAGRDGYAEAAVPISDVEAKETDLAVRALKPPGLVLTVHEVYCKSGGMQDHASALCCSVPTVYARIEQAHRQIEAWLGERQRERAAERARVEALQASVRPPAD